MNGEILMIVHHVFVDSLVFQSHQRLSLDVLLERINWLQQIFERLVINVILTDWTL